MATSTSSSSIPSTTTITPNFVTHTGHCHCGNVKFEVDTLTPDIIVWDCNCSICRLKRNVHFIIPSSQFRLLTPLSNMTLYQFNTKVAKHYFCSTCGVQAYYHPRSNPDGVAITLNCITSTNIKTVTTKFYDGIHWEDAYQQTGIKSQSQVVTEEK